eukprot:TRINITY_DN423_c0_g1_i1.p1 TRINITY_DN423_c0_g1~~TRINITY_DN423_c0_g1_i1.p1  ORF type:complete len:341 (-),score=70.17 TRINITY_DN423_c0_g1_i1:2-919(-)
MAEITNCPELSNVDVSDNNITDVPQSIAMLKKLRYLNLTNNNIDDLPAYIGTIESLTKISLEGNSMRRIRRGILEKKTSELKKYLVGRLTNDDLKAFYEAESGESDRLPSFWHYAISDGTGVKKLKLNSKQIEEIPPQAWEIPFKSVDFEDNKLSTIPDEILNISASLKRLMLSQNVLREFPAVICSLSNLTELSLKQNRISSVPSSIASLEKLESVDLRSNRLASCPEGLLKIRKLRILYLGMNSIRNIDSICELKDSHLEHVDVSNNNIGSLTPNIRFHRKLTYLNLENNVAARLRLPKAHRG